MLNETHLDGLQEKIKAIEERFDKDNHFVDDDAFQTLYDDLLFYNTNTVHYEIEAYPWDDSSEEDDKWFLIQIKRLEKLGLLMDRIIRNRYHLSGKEFDWVYETEKVEDE